MGRRETGHAAAPTNAISHWLWEDESFKTNQLNLRHTLTGYAIHHVTSVFWATLYSRAYGQRPGANTAARAVPASAVASAIACFTDYQLTPQRLQPGFEKRLSTPAMAVVYGSFALGLALGNLLLAEQRPRAERREKQDRRQRARRMTEHQRERRRWRASQALPAPDDVPASPWQKTGSGERDNNWNMDTKLD